MHRVVLQLDLDLDRDGVIEWVRGLARVMDRDGTITDPVADSDILAVEELPEEYEPQTVNLLELLQSQGRQQATPSGPWVTADPTTGEEYIHDPTTHDYRQDQESIERTRGALHEGGMDTGEVTGEVTFDEDE